MSENMERNKSTGNSSNKSITAIELAEKVIDVTSTLIPVIAELDIDNETKAKINAALTKLQKIAIDYTIAAAKRASARNNYWRRRRGTWRK